MSVEVRFPGWEANLDYRMGPRHERENNTGCGHADAAPWPATHRRLHGFSTRGGTGIMAT